MSFDDLRKATGGKVDLVLNLNDLLLNDIFFALVAANLGLETLDAHFRTLASRFQEVSRFETFQLDLDSAIQDQQAIVVVRDIGDQAGDYEVPSLLCAQIAIGRRGLRIAEPSPNVNFPGDVG